MLTSIPSALFFDGIGNMEETLKNASIQLKNMVLFNFDVFLSYLSRIYSKLPTITKITIVWTYKEHLNEQSKR